MKRLAIVLLLVSACSSDDGPHLSSADPPSAGLNATVTLTGSRLCGPTGDCTTTIPEVQLGLSNPVVGAPVVMSAATSFEIVIPPNAPIGKTELVVTVDDTSSNALDFEVTQ